MTATLQLAKNRDRRLRAGHLWIYSNEVDQTHTPLRGLAPGEQVAVLDHGGKWLAWAYVNPHSLICARVVSRDREHPLDGSLLVHRLKVALSLRERLFPTPHYRLCFGEADGLPGLVVDRYGDHLVAQITTAGMEARREAVAAALEKVLRPAGILWRNDSPVREMEGLERYVALAAGAVPERLLVEEGGCRFEVSPYHGQKSGWFYDQAANRDRLLKYVPGRRLLDCCSYLGGWAIRALAAGASGALCVDSSPQALEGASHNAGLNGVSSGLQTRRGDAFAVLRALRQEGERFDVVVLDPPAFIKRRKDLREGTLAYRRLNEAALGVLSRDGILVSASCSFHLSREDLLRTVQQASRHRERMLQLLEQGTQGPDHPVHPAIPETAYLKAFYLRVLPGF